MRWTVLVALAALAPQEGRIYSNSYKGKAPPELVSEKSHWLNAADRLTLESFKGKVVWLEFGYVKCSGCRKMEPHLIRWNKEYADKGFVVLNVNDGAQDPDIAKVKDHLTERSIPYPVLWDKEGKNCKVYGIDSYPAAFLIAADGTVAWEGEPFTQLKDAEKAVLAELGKLKK